LSQHLRQSDKCPYARHVQKHGGTHADYMLMQQTDESRSSSNAAAGGEEELPPADLPPFDLGGEHYPEEEEMSMPDVAEEGAEVAAEYDFPPFDFGGAHYPEEEESSGSEGGDERDEVGPDQEPAVIEDILRKHEAFHGKNPDGLPVTNEYLVLTSLAQLLRKCNAPLKLFDDVLEWAYSSSQLPGFACHHKKLPLRETYTSSLFRRFNLTGIAPIKEEVVLPDTGSVVELVTHDVESLILSILTCPRIMSDENFLFTDDDPFAPPPARPAVIDDVNTGSRYREAHKALCTDPTRHVFFPMMAFADKTHLDVHGNLCLEPVSLCPLFVKRSVRNQPWAWRTIGYIPNQSTHSHTSSLGKCKDLQFMLAHVLKAFIAIQNSGGVRWKLKYKGVTHNVILKFTLLFMMGDTEGHNKYAARYLSNGNMKQLCRYCTCPAECSDDPHYKFTYRTQKSVLAVIASGDAGALQAISQQPVYSALYRLTTPGCLRGIYGILPPEWLHMMQKGLFERAVTCFLGLKKLRKKTGKKVQANQKKRKVGATAVYTTKGQDVISHSVFTTMMLDWIDKEATIVGRQIGHQSDRNWPRTHFPLGLSVATKLAAHEQSGVLLLFVVLLCSTHSSDILIAERGLDTKRIGAYIGVFEGFLLWEQWAKRKDGFKPSTLKHVEEYIPKFLDMAKRVLDRSDGKGLAIVKFHLPLHMIDDLRRFGSPLNVDSGIGEHNHISNVKEPARRTQRTVQSLEFQTANRVSENIAHGLAGAEYHRITSPSVVPSPLATSLSDEPQGRQWKVGGSIFLLDGTRCFQRVGPRNVPVRRAIAELPRIQKMQDLVPFFNPDDDGFVRIRTEIQSRNGDLVRAHHNYYGRGPWYDWYNVNWGEDGDIPAQVRLFIQVIEPRPAPPGRTLTPDFSTIDSVPGIYAIVESLENPLYYAPPGDPQGNYLLNQSSRIVYWGKKCQKANDPRPAVVIVNVDAFDTPCTGIPDPQNEKEHANRDDIFNYLFLRPRDEWAGIFEQEARNQFQNPGYDDEDDEDTDDTDDDTDDAEGAEGDED